MSAKLALVAQQIKELKAQSGVTTVEDLDVLDKIKIVPESEFASFTIFFSPINYKLQFIIKNSIRQY